MIIRITKSILFTTDPDIRFASEHHVPLGLWRELWKKYKLQEYEVKDLCDLYHAKTGNRISRRALQRWIRRTEIYSRTKPAIERGVESVTSDFFGNLEWMVLKELFRNMKVSGTETIRVLP